MPKGTPREHDSLADLVEQLRAHTEKVWDRHLLANGDVEVLLIEERDIPQAERMQAIGLAGGQGRSLTFTQRDEKWVLVEEGTWIG